MILIVLMGMLANDDASRVRVTTGKAAYAKDEVLALKVENRLAEPLFLPGCNHYLIERQEGSDWKVAREKRCFWEGYAVEVPAGDARGFDEPLEGIPAGTYRVRVDYRLGCRPGEPLSRAGCKDGGTVVSEPFAVR